MLEILQNLFVLPLIAACIIMICVRGYIKMSHQDELYEKRDYVRYFLFSYIAALATYYVYQKFMGESVPVVTNQSGGASELVDDVVESVADNVESLVDNVASSASSTTYGIATNIMERFNTGRPTF
jgi:hypothetical protein